MSLSNALSYLTVLPIPFRPETPLSRSVHYFPLVGVIMGSLLVIVSVALQQFLPALIAMPLIIILLEGMTGGMHLRGLADAADQLKKIGELSARFFHNNVGLLGLLSVSATLCIKTISLIMMREQWQGFALLLTPIFGRSAQALGLIFCRHQLAGDFSHAEFVQRRRIRAFCFVFILLSLTTLLPIKAALFILAQYFIGITLLLRFFNHRHQGLTLSSLSAVSEFSETSLLLLCGVISRVFY